MPGFSTVCRGCGKSGEECRCLQDVQRDELICLVLLAVFVVGIIVASICHVL